MTFPPIHELLPHEPPMVLLDDVIAKDDTSVTCALTLRADAPFVAAGRAQAVVALEYMAQAAGVFAGLEAHARGESIQWGFLIGCSELDLEASHMAVGDRLVVTAKRVWGDARLGQFEARVTLDSGQGVAKAVLNVAQADPREM